MLKAICAVFSFLTILPVSKLQPNRHTATTTTTLETVAEHMYLFPIVGIVIGALVGFTGFGMSEFAEPLLVSLVMVTILVIITGLHHIDGLADFADGLMVQGTTQAKLDAMKDTTTGSAGVVAVVLYLIGLTIILSEIPGFGLVVAVILAEVLAKFCMVLMAGLGSAVSHTSKPGSGSVFVNYMKKNNNKRLGVSCIITIVIVVVVGGTPGLMMFGASIGITLILLAVSTRSFDGVTGDVMGATNEIVRLATLGVFLVVGGTVAV